MNKSMLWKVAAPVLLIAGFLGGRALATGGPTQLPLTWSGTVTDETGTPYPTAVDVTVAFFDSPNASLSKCTSPVTQAAANSGRFSVLLPAACAQAVHDAPDLWTEATVGPNSTVLPRVHVGAVPYALESDSASVAGTAKNVTCVGCVNVDKMAFDKDVNLTTHTLSAAKLSTGASGASLTTGSLDLGPTVGDELSSAAVKTLTGGGVADALHTHAGLGGTSPKFKGVTSSSFLGSAGYAAMNTKCASDYGSARVCKMAWLDDMFPAPKAAQVAWVFRGSTYDGTSDGPEFGCNKFSDQSSSAYGWLLTTTGAVTADYCNIARPAACCGP